MDNPIVSIITPTYNHERFIGQCLDSVLSQAFREWEQIVVDDGSTDQTAAIVARYAGTEPRIHLIQQENRGIWHLGETYNHALTATRGEFIAILEGDDYWNTQTLQILVDHLTQLPNEYAVAYGQMATVGGKEVEIIGGTRLPNNYGHPAVFAHQIITPIARVPAQASLTKKAVLEQIGGFKQSPALPLVDRPTFLAIALQSKFYHVPAVLAYWRQHDQNTTRLLSLQIAAGSISWVSDFFENVSDDLKPHLRISREAAVEYHQRRAFLMAASVLHRPAQEQSLEGRWQVIRTTVAPYLRPWQRHILRTEYLYKRLFARPRATRMKTP
jgi:glycosyltransferase involved in cell wall biosynthesis